MSETATISKFNSAACFMNDGIRSFFVRSENPTMPTRTRSFAPRTRVCDAAGDAERQAGGAGASDPDELPS